MKSVYKKGMTVEEIEAAAESQWARLKEVSIYLNQQGEAAMAVHNIISNACVFAESIVSLKEDLTAAASREESERPEVAKKLQCFITKFL